MKKPHLKQRRFPLVNEMKTSHFSKKALLLYWEFVKGYCKPLSYLKLTEYILIDKPCYFIRK